MENGVSSSEGGRWAGGGDGGDAGGCGRCCERGPRHAWRWLQQLYQPLQLLLAKRATVAMALVALNGGGERRRRGAKIPRRRRCSARGLWERVAGATGGSAVRRCAKARLHKQTTTPSLPLVQVAATSQRDRNSSGFVHSDRSRRNCQKKARDIFL